MQHDGLSTSMGGLWRNLDAMATTDPAGGFRTAEYTRSALIRRMNLVGYRKRYFVMQLGLRLLYRGTDRRGCKWTKLYFCVYSRLPRSQCTLVHKAAVGVSHAGHEHDAGPRSKEARYAYTRPSEGLLPGQKWL